MVTPAESGIWWAVCAAVVIQGVLMTIWFERGRWKQQAI
jgi:Na+-driven multidrug efflux pump